MAGKNLTSKADDGFKPQLTVFLSFEWRLSVFLFFLARQKTQILPVGFFSLVYLFFLHCGNAVFFKTEKKH